MPRTDGNIFLVGGYEAAEHDEFPLLVQPIVAMREGAWFWRVNYRIERPYTIRIAGTVGEPKTDVVSLFPHRTFLFCEPRPLGSRDMVVFVSRRTALVSSNPWRLSLRVALHSLARQRQWSTIKACCADVLGR